MKKQIFGQIGRLKPEKVEEYKELHAHAWPGVLKTIEDCNLRNYSIFIREDLVFACFEYIGEDYDGEMEKMAQYISGMIGLFFDGQDAETCQLPEEGCTHDCCTCGGCH